MRYKLLKDGVPVAMAHSQEECDRLYMEHGCDDVVEVQDDGEQSRSSTWLDAGFERDAKGWVVLFWECKKCGLVVGGGMEKPKIECPNCANKLKKKGTT